MEKLLIPQAFLKKVASTYGLSESELQAVALAVDGESTKVIAQQLGTSDDAVRKRLSEVYRKCGVEGRGPVKLARLQNMLMTLYQEDGQETTTLLVSPSVSSTPSRPSPANPKHLDWGEAPEIQVFYGRQPELNRLQDWIQQDQCRLLLLHGLSGIGKTALAVRLAEQPAIHEHFDGIVWRSLKHAPSLDDLLDGLFTSLGVTTRPTPQDTRARLSHLLDVLRNRRYLLILDDGEYLLQPQAFAGNYREGYHAYGELLRRVGEARHQSCLILISTEKINDIAFLEGDKSPVRTLQLEGLQADAAIQLLADKELQPSEAGQWQKLIAAYYGNPLALKVVASTIKMLFGGSVEVFFEQDTPLVVQEIRYLIEELFERLSESEVEIMFWLALASEPLDLQAIQNRLLTPLDISVLMQAVTSLRQRSLIITDLSNTGKFELQAVILDYVTGRLFDSLFQEICQLIADSDQTQAQLTLELQLFLRQSLLVRLKIFNVRQDSGFSRALIQLKHKLQAKFPDKKLIVEPLKHIKAWLETESLVKNTYAGENIAYLTVLLTENPN